MKTRNRREGEEGLVWFWSLVLVVPGVKLNDEHHVVKTVGKYFKICVFFINTFIGSVFFIMVKLEVLWQSGKEIPISVRVCHSN